MLKINIFSFSYKKGVPAEEWPHGGGFVFDCRCLNNPGREEAYRQKTGQDPEVKSFLESLSEAQQYYGHVFALVDQAVSKYLSRSFESLSIYFGCTGGQHRSVYMAERLAADLGERVDLKVTLLHRDMPRSFE